MKKYISYNKEGKEIKKEYSDITLIELLKEFDSEYSQFVVFNETPLYNEYKLDVVLFNKRPREEGSVCITVSDGTLVKNDKKKFYDFTFHLEKILQHVFPEKHMYSQKEQENALLETLFSIPAKVDYRKQKVIDNCMPEDDIENLKFNEVTLINELRRDIEYLDDIDRIDISVSDGEFSKEYNDYIYAIIIQIHGVDDFCEIDIYDFLEKFDGIDKIKETIRDIENIISVQWPGIIIEIDETIKREQG